MHECKAERGKLKERMRSRISVRGSFNKKKATKSAFQYTRKDKNPQNANERKVPRSSVFLDSFSFPRAVKEAHSLEIAA